MRPSGLGTTRGPGVQTGQINPWEGQWQYTDIPEYAEDASHGSNRNENSPGSAGAVSFAARKILYRR